jgi:SAM-dependent methyltransferase
METSLIKPAYFSNDEVFDRVYSSKIRSLSKTHWTPLRVARKAAEFLAHKNDTQILDIGSGVGKFCLAGAYYFPAANFYGVEQREDLVNSALIAKEAIATKNVNFIHANFTQLDLENYDSFYFYNSFFENVVDIEYFDDSLETSIALYIYYSNFLCQALNSKPSGTRLVTYHGVEDEIPASYKMVDHSFNRTLKMWIRR